MKTPNDYIASGILEEYVLGLTSNKENEEITKLSANHPEILSEIEAISNALVSYADIQAPPLDPTIKPMLIATIDYMERLKAGENQSFPPELNENSKITDFKEWLDRKDMAKNTDFVDYYAKLIGHTPQMTTGIVWIKENSPEETHHEVYEKFLIIEGSCDVTIENKIYSLATGDYISIPLHCKHDVRITSEIPCKAILQRIAA